jgi:NADH:ubiquinone oxidoreductase subunit F (NADH-binding)
VVDLVGGLRSTPQAVLLGGYFGTWSRPEEIWDIPLDPAVQRRAGRSLGCGLISLFESSLCGVARVAGIMSFLAGASAGQCGPCQFGLPAIAAATDRLARGRELSDDLDNVRRWSSLVRGRGACAHPDGAAQQLDSALQAFAADFASHQKCSRCVVLARGAARA